MKWQKLVLHVLVVAGLLVVAAPASAQMMIPASGNANGPSVVTEHLMLTTEDGWVVGSEDDPVGVILDPDAGPWIKVLQGVDGGPVMANDLGVPWPACYSFKENLKVGGDVPWTDWHEAILTPGWDWAPIITLTVDGADVPVIWDHTPAKWDERGGILDLYFDKIEPGSQVTISKNLCYIGDPDIIGDGFQGFIRVAQYPTPEPGTWILLAGGVLSMLAYRSIKRRLA